MRTYRWSKARISQTKQTRNFWRTRKGRKKEEVSSRRRQNQKRKPARKRKNRRKLEIRESDWEIEGLVKKSKRDDGLALRGGKRGKQLTERGKGFLYYYVVSEKEEWKHTQNVERRDEASWADAMGVELGPGFSLLQSVLSNGLLLYPLFFFPLFFFSNIYFIPTI